MDTYIKEGQRGNSTDGVLAGLLETNLWSILLLFPLKYTILFGLNQGIILCPSKKSFIIVFDCRLKTVRTRVKPFFAFAGNRIIRTHPFVVMPYFISTYRQVIAVFAFWSVLHGFPSCSSSSSLSTNVLKCSKDSSFTTLANSAQLF